MTFSWTTHRFAGGALALDVANSVILRFDAARAIDRFAEHGQMDAFAAAASTFSAEKALFGELVAAPPENRQVLIALREAIDRYFRRRILGADNRQFLADLLDAAADALRSAASERSLEAATARSALALISAPQPERMKICGNCGWLFLDKSKNRSRMWCDMAVCGNRVKASRHYRKQKEDHS
ncbi:CGNR zinc finger domain-containing protein [Rhizobium sp. S95]|uniref:CGNR zinc finger domain-containing protein n=1 Tax=Ciceribacter sichuanensis TaxID=2949647 RepID=A0AAJ1BT56_9HYPH|nr:MULTISPECIES: CGNR zinc finger domain-containing protein [unclassified Ciceribacter]MCM2395479.1 CGNR zinc finger domain-containing protein [Ciceribacter sp. S95]MCO5955901.1 CGNR zinc finger domain-containing protein [Ciceribacter sp. S101]